MQSNFITKRIRKFFKTIIGPYFKIVIPTIITLMKIFRDLFKYFMLINLIYAALLAIANILSQDIEFTFHFFIYVFYSFFFQIINYFCDMLNNFLTIVRKLLNRISDDFYHTNSYLEYKNHLNINNISPFEINKSDYVFNSTNYNVYDNKTSKPNDLETEIDVKKVFIALGITVLLVGVYVYIQDSSYYNEAIYNGYKATRDYIASFFWDRPDKPDNSTFPPLDIDKDIQPSERSFIPDNTVTNNPMNKNKT